MCFIRAISSGFLILNMQDASLKKGRRTFKARSTPYFMVRKELSRPGSVHKQDLKGHNSVTQYSKHRSTLLAEACKKQPFRSEQEPFWDGGIDPLRQLPGVTLIPGDSNLKVVFCRLLLLVIPRGCPRPPSLFLLSKERAYPWKAAGLSLYLRAQTPFTEGSLGCKRWNICLHHVNLRNA